MAGANGATSRGKHQNVVLLFSLSSVYANSKYEGGAGVRGVIGSSYGTGKKENSIGMK